MANFIELHNHYNDTPILINIEHIVGVEPCENGTKLAFPSTRISSQSSSNTISSVYGQMDCVLVRESYEQVKRKLLEYE